MPIYEYQCQQCGYALEMMQKINDAPLRQCPACGEEGLQKQVSRTSFRLKGSGWYETDFKNPSKQTVANKESAKAAATTSTQGGSETKSSESKTSTAKETSSQSTATSD